MSGFRDAVFSVVRTIPRGQTMTYRAVAKAIGKPGAARAVGRALGTNTDPQDVPCHRVIASDGSLGGYRWGVAQKQQRLREEGVDV